ncbi:kinase domain protein [Ceratobasidium sp. AG-Ba]|nr:kinase domain protein [Ceratobasidium sp. AG-Ba]QRW13588.1 kinase domain protein [Ceratobasidium sp. AG-Ba]
MPVAPAAGATSGLIRDFTDGIHYMHTAPKGPVMHGDLKPKNILIGDRFVAKIADFGLSRAIKKYRVEQTTSVVGAGTLRWMAPEALSRHTEGLEPERPNSPADIWAWGQLVYETISGKMPYSHCATEFIAVVAIMRGELNPHPVQDDGNTDLFLAALFWPVLEGCWAFDPTKRPRITEIVRGGPFASITARRNDDALLFREDPARFDSALRYKRQGEIAYRKGRYQEALDYYEKAHQIFERMGDLWCLVATGLLDIDAGDWGEAHRRFNDAADIAISEEDQGLLGRSRE